MTEYTVDEISKLDLILKYIHNNKMYINTDKRVMARKLEVPLDEFNFLYNEIIEFSQNDYHIAKIMNPGTTYPIIESDFSTERFLQNGGFKKYFSIKKEKELNQARDFGTNIKAENVVINHGTVKSLKQKKSPIEKKTRWDLIGIITVILALLTLLFGDNIYEKFKSPKSNSIHNSSTAFVPYSKNFTLPYLESAPILDKGLFLQHHYGDLIFGGSNLDKLKVNARNENGEKLEIKKDDNGDLVFDIFKNPYIEFEYKKEFYVIQIKSFDYGDSFVCNLKKIKKPTLNLTDIEKI
jgi:hypothetical protein